LYHLTEIAPKYINAKIIPSPTFGLPYRELFWSVREREREGERGREREREGERGREREREGERGRDVEYGCFIFYF
jgi:hypothetical protein